MVLAAPAVKNLLAPTRQAMPATKSIPKINTAASLLPATWSQVLGETRREFLPNQVIREVIVPHDEMAIVSNRAQCDDQARQCLLMIPASFIAGGEEKEDSGEIQVEFISFYPFKASKQALLFSIPLQQSPTPYLQGAEGLQKPIALGIFPALQIIVAIDGIILNNRDIRVQVSASESGATLAFYTVELDATGAIIRLLRLKGLIKVDQGGSDVLASSSSTNSGASTPPSAGNNSQSPSGSGVTVLPGTPGQPQPEGSSTRTTVQGHPTEIIEYTYDALGRPVKKTSNNISIYTHTTWGYFGGLRTIEVSPAQINGGRSLEFIHGLRGVEYLFTKNTDGGSSTELREYALHKDHLGSTTAITDETTQGAGRVLYRYYYDPFGEPYAVIASGAPMPSKPVYNPVLYTGQYYDGSADLHLFPFRAYDSHLGRFLQLDPLGFPDGSNSYAYVNNSPYAFTDPLGLAKKDGGQSKTMADFQQGIADMKRGCMGCAPGSGLALRLISSVLDPAYAQARGIDPVKKLHDDAIAFERRRLYGHFPSWIDTSEMPVAIDFALPGSTAELALMAAGTAMEGALALSKSAQVLAKGAKSLERADDALKAEKAWAQIAREEIPMAKKVDTPNFRLVKEGDARFVEFEAKEAYLLNESSPAGNNSPDTLASITINPEGKPVVMIYEGKHRAIGAAQGRQIDPVLGGIPGRPGWLRYEYDGLIEPWPAGRENVSPMLLKDAVAH